MMNIKTLAVVTLVMGAAVLPLSAVAQGRGQGGGGFGQRGGGMMQMQNSKALILARSDVRKDIKTTADQNTKLDALQKDFRDKMQAMFQGMGGGRGQGGNGGGGGGGAAAAPDFAELQKKMEEMNKTFEESSMKLLDEGQTKRLGQISLQMQGNNALNDKKIQEELKFTVDQKRKIDDLKASMDAANQAIFQRMQNGEIDRTEIRPLMEENTKILDAELAKVLTADQTKAFEAMKGEKFARDPKVDEEMRNMMGRRGGGGN
ncbi:MAG: hypothetical protein ACKVQS_09120 [Fimbriimonadaceae bacterium]